MAEEMIRGTEAESDPVPGDSPSCQRTEKLRAQSAKTKALSTRQSPQLAKEDKIEYIYLGASFIKLKGK